MITKRQLLSACGSRSVQADIDVIGIHVSVTLWAPKGQRFSGADAHCAVAAGTVHEPRESIYALAAEELETLVACDCADCLEAGGLS